MTEPEQPQPQPADGHADDVDPDDYADPAEFDPADDQPQG